jgi:hypothetical protein
MIVNHHKITTCPPGTPVLAESFRRADWIDVTRGSRRFGLSRAVVNTIVTGWPSAGFHRRLVQLTLDRWWRHPLNPLPMFKW